MSFNSLAPTWSYKLFSSQHHGGGSQMNQQLSNFEIINFNSLSQNQIPRMLARYAITKLRFSGKYSGSVSGLETLARLRLPLSAGFLLASGSTLLVFSCKWRSSVGCVGDWLGSSICSSAVDFFEDSPLCVVFLLAPLLIACLVSVCFEIGREFENVRRCRGSE